MRKKYEYMYEEVPREPVDDYINRLNALGADGWQLVTMVGINRLGKGLGFAYFIREVPEVLAA